MEEKQKAWDRMKNKILAASHTHGTPGIEKDVVDTTVALQLLGVNVSESCEGHIKHDSIFPYVMFESEKDSQIYNEAADQKHPLPQSAAEYKNFIETIKTEAESMKNKVQALLDEFYTNKQYNPYNYEISEFIKNRKFMLVPNGVTKTTQNQEAEYKKITLEESRKRLSEFTEFLKQKYFTTA